jgi:ABC-2 type transport system permease protein
LSDNQIVAFIVAVFLCFFYFGFEGLATVVPNMSSIIASLGMQDHFKHEPRRIRHKIFFILQA